MSLLLALLALASCATSPAPPPRKESFATLEGHATPTPAAATPANVVEGAPVAPAPPPVSGGDLADPVVYAARFRRSETCEQAARNALAISRDKGWEVLRACVKRGQFTLIRRLLDGTWDAELQSRLDAGLVIAQVVAARGGDVMGDLNLIRQRRLPIFALGPAATHPDLYRGRLLLMRARVADVKLEKGKPTARLAEITLAAQTRFIEGESRWRSSRSSSAEGSANIRSSKYGSASADGRYSGRSESTSGYERKRTDNAAIETGVEALARLARPDPFFEPGREYVVLARFDGVHEVPGEDGEAAESMPVLSVIGYAEPSASIVE